MINKKIFKLFLLISLLSLLALSCSNKSTAPTTSTTDNETTVTKTITKDQILGVLQSLSAFEVGGEIWDFSQITDLSKLYDYKKDIYNSVQLTSSTKGSASVNVLVKKLKEELTPKLDAIGIYFPEDVTTLWGDPNSMRPLHVWFKLAAKDGYAPDKEIEQLFSNELMIIFITQANWIS